MNPLLMPIVAAQGIWARKSIKILPPAAGPTTGSAGDTAGGTAVRLAVLGESTAAGCGVDAHDDGFPGSLARTIAERTDRPVTWEAIGQDGATARRIRYKLLPRLGEDLTVAVLLAGVNDVLGRRSPAQWTEDLGAVVDELGKRAEHVVVAGIPPFMAFPSLPGTLRRYLSQRAEALDAASRRVCAERPGALWIGSADIMPVGPDFFSEDRFHPSAYGYLRWAQGIADHLPLTAAA
ncbi:lysophospholipase L1-like esterase [Saccharothrix ecbatanensis]|uniref:Lysophospholipase L1-like esterase n=1 Tax=Saccharothrix ecbatanensis TaxID=1105145 RepID=A0A7W9HIG9_9PSEU|nr:SGNH/GDSL hydrolase family protein [Saccharothrix ecbatanensis]MBB5802815.1 lysophospholipase L1-like esterase [Saccharothrix ecbatanensis]